MPPLVHVNGECGYGDDPVKAIAIVLVTCLFAGCADAKPKDKIVGKQVRLPHHREGTIVGRSEGGFVIISKTKGDSRLDEGYESPMGLSRARRRGVIK
jgi:hypothetical protein